jgi:hypothetical protein
MKRTHRLVLIITLAMLVVTLALPAGIVAAEAEPEGIKDVQVWVLPEFDDPRLLIMMEGELVGVPPPATVRFLVPDSAEMYSAGSKDAQDQYLNPSGEGPRREPSEIPGWDEISYEVVTDTFRVEYYAPLILGSPDKTIAYDFYTRYDVANLNVTIGEPRNSSDYVVVPESDAKTTAFNLNAQVFAYRDIAAGDVRHFDISYTKSDPNPSVSDAPTSTPPSGGTPSPSGGGGGDAGLITGGITGGLMIVALLAYMLFGRRKRKPSRTRAAKSSAVKTKAAVKYCRQCGRQIEKSARFCQYCGAGQ